MAVPPSTPPAEPAVEPTATAIVAPPSPQPAYASFHTALKRVDELRELPTERVWIRDKDRILQEVDIKTISPTRLPALHAAVAAGRVYAIWDHRYLEFDELGPEWHKAVAAKVKQGE